MEISVGRLFERYERLFQQYLDDEIDMDAVASVYAAEFIMASPRGVMSGKNDERLKQVMLRGFEHYRSIGTKQMRIRGIRTSAVDERHCVAHVAWTATYARTDSPKVEIDFDVHYLVQQLDGEPTIFGWISGDEQALLKQHGIN